MSDLASPHPQTVDPVGRSLAAVGFGMFALLAQVPLTEVVSLPALGAQIESEAAAAEAAAAPSPLDEMAMFDDASLVVPAAASAPEPDLDAEQAGEVREGAPDKAVAEPAQAAPTLAMLNEISYLDL